MKEDKMKRKQTTRVENLKNDLVNLRLSKRMIGLKIKETKKRIRTEKINQRFESKKVKPLLYKNNITH